jgi:hypothetical protein
MALLDVRSRLAAAWRWGQLNRFTLHISIRGTLFPRTGHSSDFKDLIAEGSTRRQSVRFSGVSGGEKCGSFQPDAITIESLDGQILRTWPNPSLAFPDVEKDPLADDLHLVFFCGVAIWNYLTTPFLLARPDVEVEELTPWQEHSELWRRLRAPSRRTSDSLTEQVFYFDEKALQRRTDHDLLGSKVARAMGHQTFNGIVVPTLRRSLMCPAEP